MLTQRPHSSLHQLLSSLHQTVKNATATSHDLTLIPELFLAAKSQACEFLVARYRRRASEHSSSVGDEDPTSPDHPLTQLLRVIKMCFDVAWNQSLAARTPHPHQMLALLLDCCATGDPAVDSSSIAAGGVPHDVSPANDLHYDDDHLMRDAAAAFPEVIQRAAFHSAIAVAEQACNASSLFLQLSGKAVDEKEEEGEGAAKVHRCDEVTVSQCLSLLRHASFLLHYVCDSLVSAVSFASSSLSSGAAAPASSNESAGVADLHLLRLRAVAALLSYSFSPRLLLLLESRHDGAVSRPLLASFVDVASNWLEWFSRSMAAVAKTKSTKEENNEKKMENIINSGVADDDAALTMMITSKECSVLSAVLLAYLDEFAAPSSAVEREEQQQEQQKQEQPEATLDRHHDRLHIAAATLLRFSHDDGRLPRSHHESREEAAASLCDDGDGNKDTRGARNTVFRANSGRSHLSPDGRVLQPREFLQQQPEQLSSRNRSAAASAAAQLADGREEEEEEEEQEEERNEQLHVEDAFAEAMELMLVAVKKVFTSATTSAARASPSSPRGRHPPQQQQQLQQLQQQQEYPHQPFHEEVLIPENVVRHTFSHLKAQTAQILSNLQQQCQTAQMHHDTLQLALDSIRRRNERNELMRMIEQQEEEKQQHQSWQSSPSLCPPHQAALTNTDEHDDDEDDEHASPAAVKAAWLRSDQRFQQRHSLLLLDSIRGGDNKDGDGEEFLSPHHQRQQLQMQQSPPRSAVRRTTIRASPPSRSAPAALQQQQQQQPQQPSQQLHQAKIQLLQRQMEEMKQRHDVEKREWQSKTAAQEKHLANILESRSQAHFGFPDLRW